MATIKEFLDLLYSQVDRGIYVWGGNGENLLCMSDPKAWIRKRETTKKNAERDITLYEDRVAHGVDPIRAFDCSGLVYWAQKEAGVGYTDHTANGWYKECNKVETLSEGDLVFHHNGIKCTHVGVYVGGNTVIEAEGRDVGVVATSYTKKAKYWNRQGRLKKMKDDVLLGDANCDGQVTAADAALILRYLDGLSDLTEQGKLNADYNQDGKITKEDAELIMQHIVGLKTVQVIGGSVNVRDSDSTKGNIIGVAHKGDTFQLKGIAPSGWYNIDYKGKNGYISNRSDLTKII